jgi:hypothetical protein
VQICGLLSEFHVPAQANPLFAIVTTAVLLEWKPMGTVNVFGGLLESWAEEMKACVVPRSIEILLPGVSVIPPGVGKLVTLVLLLPQPPKAAANATITISNANLRTTDRPMHPPRSVTLHRASTF